MPEYRQCTECFGDGYVRIPSLFFSYRIVCPTCNGQKRVLWDELSIFVDVRTWVPRSTIPASPYDAFYVGGGRSDPQSRIKYRYEIARFLDPGV